MTESRTGSSSPGTGSRGGATDRVSAGGWDTGAWQGADVSGRCCAMASNRRRIPFNSSFHSESFFGDLPSLFDQLFRHLGRSAANKLQLSLQHGSLLGRRRLLPFQPPDLFRWSVGL